MRKTKADEKVVLSPDQEAALEHILSQSYHLGGKAPSRDELHGR